MSRTNAVLAATAAVALSLGLTACGGGGDTGAQDAGAAASTTGAARPGTGTGTSSTGSGSGTATSATATGGGTGTAGGGTGGRAASTGKGAAAGTAAKPSGQAPVCTYQDVAVTMRKADETPTEHIVLTATNTSGRTCRLLGYPLIAFGEIQTARNVSAVAKSKPAAPVVLEPGAPAYANVRVALGGVDEETKVVTGFTVNLFAADGPAEGSDTVAVPAGGLAVDEAAAKTGYWTPELRNGADDF
ncbi:DUF4232 domain-containing protein [Streptomyces sp. NPDC016309]|uniref:DUF4232 domain-containing protein n=1 Tax=Streptomyces sp. NPDC016309 TaxID=3364965 RepID=UPI0036FBD93C